MIASSITEFVFDDLFLTLNSVVPITPVHLKLEGFSIGGSIKIKPALRMIEQLEKSGKLKAGDIVIESSSGNLGIALSIICASRNYGFICVVDPNVQRETERIMKAYGTKVVKLTEKDSNGGYLGTRIKYIQDQLKENSKLVWVNQYDNFDNMEAHALTTAPAILNAFPDVDYIFVGVGTTGTLSGVRNYMREHAPHVKLIAVDAVGSVNFGHPPGRRFIPGLGTSMPAPISKGCFYDDLVRVPEVDTVTMCHRMARNGLMLGGSTGTVLAGIVQFSSRSNELSGKRVVAISPDFGDRYIATVYDPDWVERNGFEQQAAQSEHAFIERVQSVN